MGKVLKKIIIAIAVMIGTAVVVLMTLMISVESLLILISNPVCR